jgi:hypothetical protein
MTIAQHTPMKPARRRRTSYEKLEHQVRCLSFAYARLLGKEIQSDIGPASWFQRQHFRHLDAGILAHGGRKGAGITRPRERREGDPPYKNLADAAERRWL